MKKVVLKSILEDERSKRRAMKAVAGVGVDSIEVDMKEGKITVIGDADPVWLTTKLRKMGFRVELLSVGPAKEEKKEEKKNEGPAKDQKKEAEKKKQEDEKKEAEKKTQEKKAAEAAAPPIVSVYHVNPNGYGHCNDGYSYHVVTEQYPSTCTIS